MAVSEPIPQKGGMLFHREGKSGCGRCGWSGVPNFERGRRLDECPNCEIAPLVDEELSKPMFRNVGRNEPCPCGSGKKFKKCCGA